MTTTIIPEIRHLRSQNKCAKIATQQPQNQEKVANLIDDTANSVQAIVEGVSSFSSADPLAYYVALALVQEIDYHLERGEHYRVGGQCHSTLEGVIRAIAGEKPVIELGEVVKRKYYYYPRRKGKAAGKPDKVEAAWEEIDRMVELARRLMEAAG